MQYRVRLSVVLNLAGEFDAVRKTIRHVAAQTAVNELELLIVCTAERESGIEVEALAGIPHWRTVVIAKLPYGAVGWAAAVTAAQGEAVVLAEDHSFVAPNWAATLIARHAEGYSIVAPEMKNGNPGTLTSWANFQLTFVEWFLPKGGEIRRGPGHNSSYLKDVLLGMEGDLAEWLVSEAVLHDEIKARGHKIYVDEGTYTSHVNISKFGSYLRHSYLGGRIFGGARGQGWPAWKRVVYAAGFPLVPLIRLQRLLQILDTGQKRKQCRLVAALPLTMAGLLLHAMGEATGYLFGSGEVMMAYQAFETRRLEFVIDEERSLLLD